MCGSLVGVDMHPTQGVLALVGAHCDLATRLEALPAHASVRGLYFPRMEAIMQRIGKRDAFDALVGPARFAPMRMYPAESYLVRLAAAGALLSGSEHIHEGMASICRGHASAFADSLLGRVLLKLLSTDPKQMLRQGAMARRHSATFGRWSLDFPTARSAELRFRREFIWIESALVGAAHGSFDMIGIEAQVEVELDGPYDGVHRLSW